MYRTDWSVLVLVSIHLRVGKRLWLEPGDPARLWQGKEEFSHVQW